MVLEFGDGWLLDSLIAEGGMEGFKLDIGVVRRAESDRNSNNAAIFYGSWQLAAQMQSMQQCRVCQFRDRRANTVHSQQAIPPCFHTFYSHVFKPTSLFHLEEMFPPHYYSIIIIIIA